MDSGAELENLAEMLAKLEARELIDVLMADALQMILDRFQDAEQSPGPALAAGNYLVNKRLIPTACIFANLTVHGTLSKTSTWF